MDSFVLFRLHSSVMQLDDNESEADGHGAHEQNLHGGAGGGDQQKW
jgi:hypothetical protein